MPEDYWSELLHELDRVILESMFSIFDGPAMPEYLTGEGVYTSKTIVELSTLS